MLCTLAFAAECRVAIYVRDTPGVGISVEYVMLSPGEHPPRGKAWTIYENRGGIPVGRSA